MSTSRAARARCNGTPADFYGATSPQARRWWRAGLESGAARQPSPTALGLLSLSRGTGLSLETGWWRCDHGEIFMSPRATSRRGRSRQVTRFWQLATDNVWRGDSINGRSPSFTERFPFPGACEGWRMGTSLMAALKRSSKSALMIETATDSCGMFTSVA